MDAVKAEAALHTFGVVGRRTQGDVEPGGQKLKETGQAIEERQLQLAVVAQLHQDGPQAFLQQHLRPLQAQGMHRVS